MPQLTRREIEARLADGENLRQVNLVRCDISGMNLARIDLSGANLRMADLHGSDLTEARLNGSSLSGANLTEVILVGASLVEASVIGGMLKGADLSRADLSAADLTGANLESAQLQGAYLVGAFLNETSLSGANMSAAYIRMAQMGGTNLSGAQLECADLSGVEMTASRLDGCSLVRAKLAGANLSASCLTGCDLRGADLTGADLSGCNLTGAKLNGIRFEGIRLDDTWAEWIDLRSHGGMEQRSTLEQFFAGIVGRPIAQVLIEGRVDDEAWAVILNHLRCFQCTRPSTADVKLRAIHQGVTASALYLESDHERSLAAYLAEFADIIGNGSVELFKKLATVISENNEQQAEAMAASSSGPSSMEQPVLSPLELRPILNSAVESLQNNPFWNCEKAFAIFSADRRIWFEAVSTDSLTLRPPHGSAVGVDLIRGRFIADPGRNRNGSK
jgi:uncharacterized protein YjbI with pentapeptide repeats